MPPRCDSPTINVDDVRAPIVRARSLEAQVLKDVTEVKVAGEFATITDPTGAMLGLGSRSGAEHPGPANGTTCA